MIVRSFLEIHFCFWSVLPCTMKGLTAILAVLRSALRKRFYMRRNGILMHISSLPSPYGIGTMGKAAYDFVDYLKDAGQSVWQMLPLNPTGYGDSPYSAYSTFAGNPYFIDLDLLEKDGLLQKEEYQWIDWGDNPEHVDYGKLYTNRFPVLKKASDRFLSRYDAEREKYERFKKQNQNWLDDYALFMALKEAHNGKAWVDWDLPYRIYDKEKARQWSREYAQEVEYWKTLQYFFFRQWKQLHDYASEKDIQLIGDLPFYMAPDSADVWANGELFYLNEKGLPAKVAGTPPDNPKDEKDLGQIWGNPVYNWPYHKKTEYAWWTERIRFLADLFDIVRLDHFLGFDAFYAIDTDAKDARKGKWMKGPGMDLFQAMKQNIREPEIIVEDLGRKTESFLQLMEDAGYPGMKILEYAFNNRDGEKSPYIPYNYEKNCVAYTGTHDNNTIQGWLKDTKQEDVEFAKEFMHSFSNNPETVHWDMIRTLLASPAATTILQAQDLKALGAWARMNQPGSAGGNWAWRIKPDALDAENAAWVRKITDTYGRLPLKKKSAGHVISKTEPSKEADMKH